MPAFSPETSVAPPSGACSAYDDFPYLWSRIVPRLFHIIPAPTGVDEGSLRSMARFQASCNQLPTYLVLGPRACVYVTGDGYEVTSDQIPRGGILVAGTLAPCTALEQSDWWDARSNRLRAATEHTRSGYLLGDCTKGGRPATPEELTRLAGLNADGVPAGLVRCSFCFEWKGQCLDPSPHFRGQLMTVFCRCANDNHCARCYRLLGERKLNANHYDESDGTIWHTPGFVGLSHSCERGPVVAEGRSHVHGRLR